jgi:hypothetical protein
MLAVQGHLTCPCSNGRETFSAAQDQTLTTREAQFTQAHTKATCNADSKAVQAAHATMMRPVTTSTRLGVHDVAAGHPETATPTALTNATNQCHALGSCMPETEFIVDTHGL